MSIPNSQSIPPSLLVTVCSSSKSVSLFLVCKLSSLVLFFLDSKFIIAKTQKQPKCPSKMNG